MTYLSKITACCSTGGQPKSHWFPRYVRVSPLSGFPGGASGKEPTAGARDMRDASLIPKLRRSVGVGNGNLLQYSCLENSVDKGAWQGRVYEAAKSQT